MPCKVASLRMGAVAGSPPKQNVIAMPFDLRVCVLCLFVGGGGREDVWFSSVLLMQH